MATISRTYKKLLADYVTYICTELNVERYDLRKDGNVGFTRPWGTHDDVFWSIALAVYATADMAPEPFLAVIPQGSNI